MVLHPCPDELFDRESEWAACVWFVADADPGPLLGMVLGRRRIGKTFLLRRLAAAAGGFYHVFPAAMPTPQLLERLGAASARWRGLRVPVRYATWEDALDDLLHLGLGRSAQVPVILDEISYAVDIAPELPSLLQHGALRWWMWVEWRLGRVGVVRCARSGA